MKEKEICKKYLNGMNLRSLSKEVGIGEIRLKKLLTKNSIAIRRRGGVRVFQLDEQVFSELNEESGYWIGMLLADGCLTKRNCGASYYTTLSLNVTDINHVASFQRFLKSNQPIKVYDNDGYKKGTGSKRAQLSISSEKIATKLIEYGIVPNKTPIAEAPKCLENNRDFWRGCVDGDGWVCVHNGKMPMIGLCGTKSLVEQFQRYVLTVVKTNATVPENLGKSGSHRTTSINLNPLGG